jgi:dipeptidyl aminopeptidase/acylaminoacyl peptidase
MNFDSLKSLFLLLFLAANLPLTAQKTPLIERDLFFGNPEISSGQLSPDGKYVSFLKEYEGIMNIWVKAFDEPFEEAVPITSSKRPLYGYFWTLDGKNILYLMDKDGDENINIFSVEPKGPKEENGMPKSRNLTPFKNVTAQIYKSSQKNPDLFFVGINARDKAWHDLYSLKVSTGKLELLYENTDRIVGYNFDWDDNLRLIYTSDKAGNTTITFKDGFKYYPIYTTSVTESASVIAWNKDNTKFYLSTNKGDLDLTTLYLMDPLTQEKKKIESDPENRVDFGGLSIDRNTREIISTSYTDDKTRVYWQNDTWKENYEFLVSKFPGREINFSSSTLDYSKFLISVWGDKYVTDVYFFDTKTKELVHQYTPRPKLKEVEQFLAEMKPIRYKSSDGLEIPAYLTTPVGVKAENLPLIVLVHGGPKGPRDYWGYDAEVQFLANRGYAVLQPNFRASGGFGKSFLNAGDLQWGKLMQDDITWGVKHLKEKGIADPNKVIIMGGSYGGYATLAGLAFTPDLYAAGVDIVGPSNIFTLLESVPAYWEAGKAFLHGMVGDPNTEEGKKLIREASPLFSADKITKPLLIIQGANDPRVKKAEADQIVIALRDKGKQVSYLLAEDEGHGFRKPVNKMAMYAEIEKFLASITGTRYQKDMPEEVKKRLAELRVNINEVIYTPKEELAVSETLPTTLPSFTEGSSEKYDISILVQGQNIRMDLIRTISKQGDKWIVEDATNGPMGQSVDKMIFNANFEPVKRTVSQMGNDISLTFRPEYVEAKVMGNDLKINMDGPYFSDGAGMDLIMAGIEAKQEGSISFYMPDLTTMKAKQMKMVFAGSELINNINCQKIEISNLDNEAEKITIWINPETKITEKMTQTIPAMGNAVMTMVKNIG